MGRGQISALTGIQKKLILSLMHDFGLFEASVEEVAAGMAEI